MKPRHVMIGLGIMGALSACSLPAPGGAQAPTAEPVAATTPPPANTIVADAVVVPNRYVDVTFDTAGTVAEILVQEGDQVQAGAPLAKLVTRDLELQVKQSQANLAQAQATYNRIESGATPEAVAAQQAVVQNAEAQLQQARAGGSTAADIAGARAQLGQAQAALAALLNPSASNLSTAEARVQQTEVQLQATRDSASQVKTSSELALQRSTNSLTQAQASYATAKQNWEYVQETGADPANPRITDATGRTRKNKLNDVQQQQYYNTFVQAEATLHTAEKNVTDAQVAFDQSRKSEVSSIQTVESQLADARSQLAALQNPDKNAIAQQQAAVDQARANLQRVQQGGTQAQIAAAQAAVDQQKANLEQLTVPPRPVDLAEAQASIEAGQVAVEQAQRNLERATAQAPFGGTIAQQNLEVGQRVGNTAATADGAPFVLADFSQWKIQTDDLNERDVVRVRVGSVAQITFEALPDVTITGKVTAIQPRGVDRFGDTTYTVTVIPDAPDARLLWNMSATVSIEPVAP